MRGLRGLQLLGGLLVLGVETLLALLDPGDLGLQRRELGLGAFAAPLRVGEGAGEPFQLRLGGLDPAGAGGDLAAEAGQSLPAVGGGAQGGRDPLILGPRGRVGLGPGGEHHVEGGAVGGDLRGELGLLGPDAVGGDLQLLRVAPSGLLLGFVREQPESFRRQRLHPLSRSASDCSRWWVSTARARSGAAAAAAFSAASRRCAASVRSASTWAWRAFSAASSCSSRRSELLACTRSSASSRSRESRRSACTTWARRAASA